MIVMVMKINSTDKAHEHRKNKTKKIEISKGLGLATHMEIPVFNCHSQVAKRNGQSIST